MKNIRFFQAKHLCNHPNIMLKQISIFSVLILGACNSQPQPAKSPYQAFIDTNVLFDMDSEVERYSCKIQGEIPAWLSGTLLRNGPAKFQVGDRRVDWFDGLAMLHAFEFSPQQVAYSNRFLRSEQYYLMMVEKSLDFSGFSQDPCQKAFKNQTSHFIPKEMQNIKNADVTIQEYAGKMVALTEVPLPVVFDPKTLATLGVYHYQDTLLEGQWQAAHSQYDFAAKETVSYFIRFGEKSSYVIWKMPEHESTRKVIAEIPVEFPAYMHSFALTDHYVILVEFPFVVSPIELMKNSNSFISNYRWKPERGTAFIIVNRSSGEVSKIKGAPFFAFHHVNAFDKDGKIFMDIVTYPNAKVITNNPNVDMSSTGVDGQKSVINENVRTKLERFTIALDTQNLSRETIYDEEVEMPRVRADRTAREYRYCYLANVSFPSSMDDRRYLYKVDVATKTGKSWSEEGCSPGEPIFVPRPEGIGEDDGVVLSLVLDFAHHRSFLLVLDASDLTELARAEVPHAVPPGLHGQWKEEN